MPGMIDIHVHIGYHFGKDGRAQQPRRDARRDGTVRGRERLGDADDRLHHRAERRRAERQGSARRHRRGVLPGPAHPHLARLGQRAHRRCRDQLRDYVVKQKAAGADFIKIFASKSIREGGAPTMTDEQLQAACGEAKAQGLRTLVHAHAPSGHHAAARAGCTQVEHGAFVNDEALKLMAERGVYFDPNIGLVLQNYIENKPRFLGIGNYNEEGFAFMEKAVPTNYPMFKQALAAKVKMPMGTDAVAGAHGQNAREIITRVKDGGQDAMDAIVSATSLAAESMGLAHADRRARPGPAGRHRGRRRRPAPGHHRASPRLFGDERRASVQALGSLPTLHESIIPEHGFSIAWIPAVVFVTGA